MIGSPRGKHLRECRIALGLRELLDGRDQTGYFDGVLDQRPAVLKKLRLELPRFLGLCELAGQMLTKLSFTFPRRIAERALDAIEKLEPLFDEGASLQCCEQSRIGIEFSDVGRDCFGFSLAELGRVLRDLSEGFEIAERRFFVELGRLGSSR